MDKEDIRITDVYREANGDLNLVKKRNHDHACPLYEPWDNDFIEEQDALADKNAYGYCERCRNIQAPLPPL